MTEGNMHQSQRMETTVMEVVIQCLEDHMSSLEVATAMIIEGPIMTQIGLMTGIAMITIHLMKELVTITITREKNHQALCPCHHFHSLHLLTIVHHTTDRFGAQNLTMPRCTQKHSKFLTMLLHLRRMHKESIMDIMMVDTMRGER